MSANGAFYDIHSLWFSHRPLANQSWYIHINSVRKSQCYSTIVYVSVVRIHFTIFFRFTFTPATSIPYHGQKANWLYQERKFPGTFGPGNEHSWEHSFPGAKVPRFRSWERRFPLGTFLRGAKIPGSVKSWYHFKVTTFLKSNIGQVRQRQTYCFTLIWNYT